jgi:hypothetical protein
VLALQQTGATKTATALRRSSVSYSESQHQGRVSVDRHADKLPELVAAYCGAIAGCKDAGITIRTMGCNGANACRPFRAVR